MARAVEWAGRAKSDLRLAVEYIRNDSPESAKAFLSQVFQAARSLSTLSRTRASRPGPGRSRGSAGARRPVPRAVRGASRSSLGNAGTAHQPGRAAGTGTSRTGRSRRRQVAQLQPGSSARRAHTTAGSSGVPDHVGARFSQPSGVTATVSSWRIPNSPRDVDSRLVGEGHPRDQLRRVAAER